MSLFQWELNLFVSFYLCISYCCIKSFLFTAKWFNIFFCAVSFVYSLHVSPFFFPQVLQRPNTERHCLFRPPFHLGTFAIHADKFLGSFLQLCVHVHGWVLQCWSRYTPVWVPSSTTQAISLFWCCSAHSVYIEWLTGFSKTLCQMGSVVCIDLTLYLNLMGSKCHILKRRIRFKLEKKGAAITKL